MVEPSAVTQSSPRVLPPLTLRRPRRVSIARASSVNERAGNRRRTMPTRWVASSPDARAAVAGPNTALDEKMACVNIYVEAGSKRVFAGAIEWPGWCRSGRDESGAIAALLDSGSRYATVVRGAAKGFSAPQASALSVVERLTGNATTDFGAPSIAPVADARPVDAAELKRLLALLGACWEAFDGAVEGAAGRSLRKGPRGGGREIDAIVEHVVGAEGMYVTRLAAKGPRTAGREARSVAPEMRDAVRDALRRAVTEGLPAAGPRGGKIWLPRFAVRREAWHVLDHAWEIEDRSTSA